MLVSTQPQNEFKSIPKSLVKEFVEFTPGVVYEMKHAAIIGDIKQLQFKAKLAEVIFKTVGFSQLVERAHKFITTKKINQKQVDELISLTRDLIKKAEKYLRQNYRNENNICLKINLDYIAEMDKDSPGFGEEMIKLYSEQSTVLMDEMKHAVEEHNADKMLQLLHKMKSSFKMFSCETLIQQTTELEEALEAHENWSIIKEQFNLFSSFVSESLDEVKKVARSKNIL